MKDKKVSYSMTPESAALLAQHLINDAIQAKGSNANVGITFDNDRLWADGKRGKPCWVEVFQSAQKTVNLENRTGVPGSGDPSKGLPVPNEA